MNACAYDECYLERARASLAGTLDCGVNRLGMPVRAFWDRFLVSNVAERFQSGDSAVLAGKSGVELCLAVIGKQHEKLGDTVSTEKSPEYWAGWALAYYQWKTGLSFSRIDKVIPIEDIIAMYFPYHEMDIRQFCDRMDELMRSSHTETNLKRIRKAVGLSQSQLAAQTGIPVRTIQQYEQGQKSINGARAAYLIALSRALYCAPEELLENGM